MLVVVKTKTEAWIHLCGVCELEMGSRWVARISLKGKMMEITDVNHIKQRLIGSKRAGKKMIGLE